MDSLVPPGQEAAASYPTTSGVASAGKRRWMRDPLVILPASFVVLALLDPYSHLAFPFLVKIGWYDNLVTPLREIGSLWTEAMILGWIVAVDPPRWRRVVPAAAAVVAASLASHAIKLVVGRARPGTGEDPWTFTDGWGGFADDKFSSFPSGHATSAFALATAIAYLFPRGRAYVFSLAAACGLSRVLDARHYPTDVFAGALLGCAAARLIAGRGKTGERKLGGAPRP